MTLLAIIIFVPAAVLGLWLGCIIAGVAAKELLAITAELL